MNNICDTIKEESLKGTLEGLIDEHYKHKREHAIAICKDINTGKITPSEICKGDICSVRLPKCKTPGTGVIASFHTHTNKPYPSGMDILNAMDKLAIFNEDDTQCIGTKDSDGNKHIACYTYKNKDIKVIQDKIYKDTKEPSLFDISNVNFEIRHDILDKKGKYVDRCHVR